MLYFLNLLLIYLIVVVTCTYSLTSSAHTCSKFSLCMECVFDAAEYIYSNYQNCSWDYNEGMCIPSNYSLKKQLFDNSSILLVKKYNKLKCPRTICKQIPNYINLYICNISFICVFIISLILLIESLLYYVFYYRLIIQKPWCYPTLQKELKHEDLYALRFISKLKLLGGIVTMKNNLNHKVIHTPNDFDISDSPTISHGTSSVSEDQLVYNPIDNINTTHIFCTACKISTPNYSRDGLCKLCSLARFSLFPLIFGFSISLFTTVSLIFMTFKPWFALPYYGFLLSTGHICYLIYYYYLLANDFQIFNEGDNKATFVTLSLYLAGRDISTVFPTLRPRHSSITKESDNECSLLNKKEDTQVSEFDVEKLINQNNFAPKVKTKNKKLSVNDFTVKNSSIKLKNNNILYTTPQRILNKFYNVIQPSDEKILWLHNPSRVDILADNLWLFIFFFTLIIFSLWLLFTPIYDSNSLILDVISPSVFIVCGIFMLCYGLFCVLQMVFSTRKLYVLTSKRVVIFTSSFSSAVYSETPIALINSASVQIYPCLRLTPYARTILSFSWVASEVDRKLPPLTINSFVGLNSNVLLNLLQKFNKIVPTAIDSKVMLDDFYHLRKAWKLKIFALFIMIQLSPILFIYPCYLPIMHALTGCLIFICIFLSLVYKGWRMHFMQLIYHNVMKLISSKIIYIGDTKTQLPKKKVKPARELTPRLESELSEHHAGSTANIPVQTSPIINFFDYTINS